MNQLRKFIDPGRLEGQGNMQGIMFIGTNPSVRSTLKNIWDDPYGKYFGSFLEKAGIDKSKVWVTNIFKKPTPDNRPLLDEEIREGMKEIPLEILMVNPSVIVPLGNCASKELRSVTIPRVPIIEAYHPSFVNRNPAKRSEFINQLKQAKQIDDKKRICRGLNQAEKESRRNS